MFECAKLQLNTKVWKKGKKGLFYKEWLAVRWKFVAMTFLYLVGGLNAYKDWYSGFTSYHAGYLNPPYQTFYFNWLAVAQMVTLGMAVLLGADTIAGESGQGTITFLMTKPISRTRVYLIKLSVKAGILAVTLLGNSLVMFGLDQLNNTRAVYGNISDTEAGIVGLVPNPVMTVEDASLNMLALLGLGLSWLFLSALISIAVRSTIVTIVLGVAIIIGTLSALTYLNDYYIYVSFTVPEPCRYPWCIPAIMTVGIVLLFAGLFTFQRKEF